MKRAIRKIFGVVTASVLLTACYRNDMGGGGPQQPFSSRQLLKAETSASEYTTYNYNADGTLAKATEFSNGSSTVLTLYYHADKKLANMTSSTGEKLQPVYADNRFDTVKLYTTADGYTAFSKYEYANGRNNQRTLFIVTPSAQAVQRTTYSYSANGDLIGAVYQTYNFIDGKWNDAGRVAYTRFDSKANPIGLSALSEISQFAEPVQPRNVLEQQRYDAANKLVETIEYTYTYDSKNYPTTVTEKRTPATGAAVTTTTRFTYAQ